MPSITSLDQYQLLGSSGLRVSPLALGAMTFGNDWGWGADEATSRQMFDYYVERGGNFIDTANNYTGGTSEKFVGKFIADNRQRYVLATKYTTHMEPGNPNAGGNQRKNLFESVEASLRRMNTDYIDLLWVHSWDFRSPVEEVMRGMDDLVRQGKVHYIAASDTAAWKIAQANTVADIRGWTPFIATQTLYNLLDRTVEHEIVPMARELGVAVQPWSPLGHGVLSGKYTRDDLESLSSGADSARYQLAQGSGMLTEQNLAIVETVSSIADELGASPSQVALRWVLDRPGVVAPIVGARKLSHLEDNLGCLNIELNDEQQQRLDTATKPQPIFPNHLYTSGTMSRAIDAGMNIRGGYRDMF